MHPSSEIPGVEARAWFSPSANRYYVQRWIERPGAIDVWTANEGEFGYPETAVELPEDVFEIGANPTEWAYQRACEALHAHAVRADGAEGRIERLRQHIMRTLGTRNLPLESLVDLLLARAGAEPSPAPAPKRLATFDSALTRLTEIAGDRADMSSTWATVQGAMMNAAAARDSVLFREVIDLAAAVRVPVEERERSPEWLRS